MASFITTFITKITSPPGGGQDTREEEKVPTAKNKKAVKAPFNHTSSGLKRPRSHRHNSSMSEFVEFYANTRAKFIILLHAAAVRCHERRNLNMLKLLCYIDVYVCITWN